MAKTSLPAAFSQLELVNQWHSGEMQRLVKTAMDGDVNVNLVRVHLVFVFCVCVGGGRLQCLRVVVAAA